ncbi:MAG TPA: S8 family serine peptidase [Vicinamibacterales bacterium]|nr:S8 family serine peptidase [Vicinamibacterales bacterium]
MRIAIIDSGVHAAHPHVRGVAGGVGIDDHGELHDDYVDRLGHGTAVTAVIREKAPTAEIWAVKVFDRQLSATGAALVAALRWARLERMDLVNLSLGTTNADHERALHQEVRAARKDGVLIVAAAPEANRRWLPGALPGVVRVEMDMSMAREVCELVDDARGGLIVRASGYPRPIPGVAPERNLKGLSFAVANATGFLASRWPEWPPWLLLRHADRARRVDRLH